MGAEGVTTPIGSSLGGHGRVSAPAWREHLALRVLASLADSSARVDAIREILRAVFDATGVETAAVRLWEGEDFPYYGFHGLTEEFVRSESPLCERETDGTPRRDPAGRAVLPCLCGAVLRGRAEVLPGGLTPHGSFFATGLQVVARSLDTSRIEGFRGRCVLAGFETHLLIPLRAGCEVVGMLQLSDRRPDIFSAGDVEFLEQLGASLVVAVERKRTEEQERRLNRERLIAGQCSQALVRIADEQTMLSDFGRILVGEGGYAAAWVGLQEDGGELRIAGGHDAREGDPDSLEWVRGLAAAAVRGRRLCTVPNGDPAAPRGAHQGIAVPLFNPAGAAFGALCVLADPPRAFGIDETRLLEEVAADLAFGVCGLRAGRRERRAEQINVTRLHLLEFAATHSLDELLTEILDHIEQLTGSLISFFHFVEPDQEHLTLQCWSTRTKRDFCRAEGKGRHYPVSRAGVWADCLRERLPVVHNAYADLPQRRGLPPGHAEVVRELVVPVLREGRVVAILGVGNKPADYDPQDVEAVSLLADLASDIAERKRLEEKHRHVQAQLFQFQKMESIGTLAGGIAHDFNNLLGGVLVGLSLLELKIETRLGERFEFHDDFQDMKAQIARGADLTKQLLGFARRGKFDVKPVDVNAVVERTAGMFGRTRKDIVLRVACGRGASVVMADAAQIEQVVLNLLLNAGQAMPDGGVVTVGTETATLSDPDVAGFGVKPGPFVKLSVTDTGVGMDAETRSRIFEPFFTTKEVGQSSGLGLASAFGIVKNHGGFITVESEPGRGATFVVFLPATGAETVAAPAPADTAHAAGGAILVVDDEPQIVKAVGQFLTVMGYETLTVRSGEEAVEVFRRQHARIALVILDMIMPGMSGSQTFDALRAVDPSVKVLLCSGYSLDGQANDILSRGCRGFLQKPFDGDTLAAKLRELL